MNEHHRHSVRPSCYDYSHAGAYFITINTFKHERLPDDITDGIARLNKFGMIVDKCWHSVEEHFANVQLDEFVVMPDHVHYEHIIRDDSGLNRIRQYIHDNPANWIHDNEELLL